MSNEPIPKPATKVHITDLDEPEDAYTAYSQAAAKPEHQQGFALAIGKQTTIQLGKTCYEPRQ